MNRVRASDPGSRALPPMLPPVPPLAVPLMFMLMLLAGGCGGPAASAGSESAIGAMQGSASQDGFPQAPVTDASGPPSERRAADALAVVSGRGAYADWLLQRIEMVPGEGWQGHLQVPDGCTSEECLHWIVASDDGVRRVERLPAVAAGAAAGNDRALVRAREIAARRFPGASVDEPAPAPRAGAGRPPDEPVTLTLYYDDAGRRTRSDIQVWLDAAGGWLHTRIATAPADGFEDAGLYRVGMFARLRPEDEDQAFRHCMSNAYGIRMAQYIGAEEDSHRAQAACRRDLQWRATRAAALGLPGGDSM